MAETTKVSMKDKMLWSAFFLLTLIALVINYRYTSLSLSYKTLVWIVWALVSAGILLPTDLGKRFTLLLKEARQELKRVVWPTRRETIQTTIVVTIMVIVMSFLLWAIDGVLYWLISMLTGQH